MQKTVLIEKRNSSIHLRPRFKMHLEKDAFTVLESFKDVVKAEDSIRVSLVDFHIFLSVPVKKEHFWSPQLHLELLENEDNTTTLKGLFGPKPQVWTFFMFLHFSIGVAFLAFCVLLYTRWSLEASIVFPLAMLVALPIVWFLLYFLGQIGKDTGKKQIKELHNFMLNQL